MHRTLSHTSLICLLMLSAVCKNSCCVRLYLVFCLGQTCSLFVVQWQFDGEMFGNVIMRAKKQEHAMRLSLRCSQLMPLYPSVQLQEPSTTSQVPLFWQVHCPVHPRPKVPSEHSVKQRAKNIPFNNTHVVLTKYAVEVQSSITTACRTYILHLLA